MNSPFLIGAAVGCGILPLIWLALKATTMTVEDDTCLVVTSFGAVTQIRKTPGLQWIPSRLLPWVKTIHVSLQRDFRDYRDIKVTDSRGTTLIVDLWIELRIVNPIEALFEVEDWEAALESLVIHSATAVLGSQEFDKILVNRTEIGKMLQEDILAETSHWGIAIDLAQISKLNLLAESSRQMLDAVCASLEHAKDKIDEESRIRIALLEAQTQEMVAGLLTEAKAQYPLAVDASMRTLSLDAEVEDAYDELYGLALLKPDRVISFDGFSSDEIRAVDAAMLAPPAPQGATQLALGKGSIEADQNFSFVEANQQSTEVTR